MVNVFMASHSSLGSMFLMKRTFMSISTCSSSASFGWSGKAAGVDLHVLRAHVRKLRVSTFIVSAVVGVKERIVVLYKTLWW